MKKTTKKLALAKETVSNLTGTALDKVVGANAAGTYTTCNTLSTERFCTY